MTLLQDFQFLYPAWLVLLAPLWWLVWILLRNKHADSSWIRICDAHLLRQMQPDNRTAPGRLHFAIPLTIVLTLAILASAGPSWHQQAQPIMESASARIIALDISKSMLATDIKPDRFTQALSATREIIDADYAGETGVVVFTGAAFVLAPLSRDANTLRAFIDALEPGLAPVDGSRIDLAIDSARELLKASISGSGQIVVITAGAEVTASAVSAALLAREQGHVVSVLAIGTAAGAPLVDQEGGLLRDGQGRLLLSRSDLTRLRRIASSGGGRLVRLDDSPAYRDLLISRIKAQQLVESDHRTETEKRNAANDGIWLIWLMLPWALLLFRRNLLWVLLVMLVLPGEQPLYASDSFWQHAEHAAYDAFVAGDLELAGNLSGDPMMQAAVHYRAGRYQQALAIYAGIDSARSFYNRGNCYARMRQFPEAIAAFGEALKLDTELEAAAYNRRLIQLFLEQQDQDALTTANDSETEPDSNQLADQAQMENRVGIIGQNSTNPGDEQQLGPGFGASIQGGPIDPFEQFDGREQQLERFTLGNNIDDGPAQAIVERWIKNLPEASTELFRRKFKRDYQRQRRQPR